MSQRGRRPAAATAAATVATVVATAAAARTGSNMQQRTHRFGKSARRPIVAIHAMPPGTETRRLLFC